MKAIGQGDSFERSTGLHRQRAGAYAYFNQREAIEELMPVIQSALATAEV